MRTQGADTVYYKRQNLSFNDKDAIAFCYFDNTFLYGYSITHGFLIEEYGEKLGYDEYECGDHMYLNGRLWVNSNVIAFWDKIKFEDLDKVISDINKYIHINVNYNWDIVYYDDSTNRWKTLNLGYYMGENKHIITKFKIFENWYGKEFDKIYDKPDYSKFLIDLDYTFDWYLNHNPKLETDWENCFQEEENPDELRINHVKNAIETFSEIYKKCKKEGFINIQRQIFVDNLNDIDYNNLGQYWSFNEIEKDLDLNNKDIRITLYGEVKFNDVLWENSLDNFIYYGYEESEIKLKKGSKIKLFEMEILPKRIRSYTGYQKADGTIEKLPFKEYIFNKKSKVKIDKIGII